MGTTLALMFARQPSLFIRVVGCTLLVAVLLFASPVPAASAHAELLQSSPEHGETIGGALDEILLQFFDLDAERDQNARLFDAAGTEIPTGIALEEQRLVLTVTDPIQTPGEYTIVYAVTGIDGDSSQGAFTFAWVEGAPEPSGITLSLDHGGFDVVNFLLLLAAAAVAAFLVHRVMTALKEHRAAQAFAITEPG